VCVRREVQVRVCVCVRRGGVCVCEERGTGACVRVCEERRCVCV